MSKLVLIITTGLIIIIAILYFTFDGRINQKTGEKIEILEKWELPEILKEISGIAYLGDGLMACIQDEDGIIFIYSLDKRKIVKEIEFAGAGDYESITMAGETAYVLRSDGTIFEVSNFLTENPLTIEHTTKERSGRNFEGIAYDKNKDRLLLSIKENSGKEFRPVYSFDLKTLQLTDEPVIKINFSDTIFSKLGKKPSEKFLRPSEITIHSQSNKIYILEGLSPKILILKGDGTPEKIHILNSKQFRQAEGLSFGKDGEIFISNEGNGSPSNILKISLN